MATRALGGFFSDELRRARVVLEAPVHPVVRRRRMIAAVLTLLLLALGVVLVAMLGPETLAVYLPQLPLALVLLWISTGALRFDEREPSGSGTPATAEAAAGPTRAQSAQP